MNYTVYIDVLFLLNLVLDSLILASTALITDSKINKPRFLIASVFGAIYSTVIFFPILSTLKLVIFKVAASMIMILIAFGSKAPIGILKNVIVFYAVSLVYGGGIYAFYTLTPSGSKMGYSNGIYYIDLPLWALIVLAFAYYFFIKAILRIAACKSSQTIQKIKIELFEKEIILTALLDTGNTLYDPISMLPVMLIEKDSLANVFSINIEIIDSNSLIILHQTYPQLKFRIIPYKDISGVKNNILAFKPTRVIRINDNKEINNILIGIINCKLSQDGSYNALLHSNTR